VLADGGGRRGADGDGGGGREQQRSGWDKVDGRHWIGRKAHVLDSSVVAHELFGGVLLGECEC
jgi:hypothetical protein